MNAVTLRTAAALALAAAALTVHAQTAPAPVANPVVAAAKQVFDSKSKNIVAAAEAMPADKYSFKPTPAQMTFAHTISHVVEGNYAVCAMISDTPAAAPIKVADTDSKEALVAALKASFDYCSKSLDVVTDAKLGDTITFFGGRKTTRARALLELPIDVTDHYSQMAMYLRVNGILPPSAQPRK